MNCVNFPGATTILGRPPEMTDDECSPAHVATGAYAGKYLAFVTCWQPTADERRAIAEGAPIYLHLIGNTMQPAILSTEVEIELVGGN